MISPKCKAPKVIVNFYICIYEYIEYIYIYIYIYICIYIIYVIYLNQIKLLSLKSLQNPKPNMHEIKGDIEDFKRKLGLR